MRTRCFSRSGWWQTLCGKDASAAEWSPAKRHATCKDCLRLIKLGKHHLRARPQSQVLSIEPAIKIPPIVNIEAEVPVSGSFVKGTFMPYDVQTSREHFRASVSKHFRDILADMEKWSGFQTHGPNFTQTPDRVAKAYLEIFDGLFQNEYKVNEILSKTFPAKADEMITVGPVEVWSMCPHHFLPVFMKVWVGYIPHKEVLGLSKLARLAELMAKRPALQEDTTIDIAKTLQKHLRPQGAACLIKGRHLCMEMRGVKKSAVTTTTALEGVFRKKPEAKSEFLEAIRKE